MTSNGRAPHLILASGSAARRQVLEAAGLRIAVRPPAVDEAATKATHAAEDDAALALRLARAKAAAVDGGTLPVLGADQLLVCRGRRFNKPASRAAAADQLRALRGKPHRLVTAAVLFRDGREIWSELATPELLMRNFSDVWLAAYLHAEGDAVLASVGAYRIEGRGIQLFDRVDGEHAAILGLPLLGLLRFLRAEGTLSS